MVSRMRVAGDRSFRSLRISNFRRYFVGQGLSTIGTGVQILGQTWLVLELTDSATQLGIAITLQTLPVLLLGPWAGAIADRVDTRRVVLATSASAALAAGVLGTMVATHHVTIRWIWLFAALFGVIQAFERPAGQVLLYELVGPEDLANAVGLNATLTATGRLLGPATAALVIATLGLAACFFANMVSFVAVIAAIVRIRPVTMYPRRVAHGAVRIRDGLTYAWQTPVLRRCLVAMAIAGTLTYNFQQSVPSMIRFVFHAGTGSLGLVQAVAGLGSVIGGLAIAAASSPNSRMVGVAAIVFGAFVAATAFAPTIFLFGLLWLPCGIASTAYTSSTQALLQRRAEPAFQGRIMSLFAIAWIGTTPIGALVQGVVIDRWSARAGLALGAAAALVAGVSVVVGSTREPTPSVPERPTAPPGDAQPVRDRLLR